MPEEKFDQDGNQIEDFSGGKKIRITDLMMGPSRHQELNIKALETMRLGLTIEASEIPYRA
ncbi:hypothetical protein [Methylobacterium sp. R2-1]|uniref:hypothetical protein n=1 Tax=Methylobacterium sp. R2-1 TaxID=2587064 RepID=UPI00160AF542|nr:hypothetical protein [Methylobacterium sp. R2-1]MBB2963346.1 hypothetical protein [Methylobacterium sp. R2-1]